MAEFLLARIAEDEAMARAAAADLLTDEQDSVSKEWATSYRAQNIWPSHLAHLSRWDPTRVLAECEAKRRIVEDWRKACAVLQGELSDDNPQDDGAWTAQAEFDALVRVSQALALPYADHPDYDPEWKV